MYLLARLLVKRRYREPLTLGMVAKALASSPRQVQRVYAQFGSATFRDDLLARRMVVAAELLSLPAIQVREVARQVGYRKPSHFTRAFRCIYGVPLTAFCADLHQARDSGKRPCKETNPLRIRDTQTSTPSHRSPCPGASFVSHRGAKPTQE